MPRARGFTLVELMVTLAVLVILAMLAMPSFIEFRQRSALRGAADQVASFWGDSRFAAVRANSLVKVGFKTGAGGFCIGAATTTDPADDAGCDCFTAGACNVGSYPSDQSEWRGVRVAGLPTIGDTDTDDSGTVVIDPKRATLTQAADAGRILLQGPTGRLDYRMDVVIDRNGRAIQCQPATSPGKMSDYLDRQC